MSSKVLEVSGLVVKYENMLILDRVSVEVRENEIVGLAGSNGSGKSTLMNAVAGIKEAEDGEVTFLGKKITGLPPRDRRRLGMALVPQEENVFSQMSVGKNLDVAAHLMEKRKRREKTDYIYELFPVLKERETQVAGSLSGGEQRMLAIALGLAADPSLLLIDEPSIGLAPKLVAKLFDALRRIKSDTGISIVVAEQNVGILEIAERVYGLEGKTVIFGKRTEDLDEDLMKKLYLGGN